MLENGLSDCEKPENLGKLAQRMRSEWIKSTSDNAITGMRYDDWILFCCLVFFLWA
jgi:hypothetical protein